MDSISVVESDCSDDSQEAELLAAVTPVTAASPPTRLTDVMGEALKRFSEQYGPYAFGIITLLILWATILKPQLDKQSLDYENQRKIIEMMNSTLDSQRAMLKDQDRLSENLRQTSVILEKIIDRLGDDTKSAPELQ